MKTNPYSFLLLCAQLCPTLCDPMDYSPPGSSVHGILYATTMVCVAISYTGDLSKPRIKPVFFVSPARAGRFLPLCHLSGRPFFFYSFKFFIEIEKIYILF